MKHKMIAARYLNWSTDKMSNRTDDGDITSNMKLASLPVNLILFIARLNSIEKQRPTNYRTNKPNEIISIQNHHLRPLFMKCLNKFSPFIHNEMYSKSILCLAVAVVVVGDEEAKYNCDCLPFHSFTTIWQNRKIQCFEWWSVYAFRTCFFFIFWLYYSVTASSLTFRMYAWQIVHDWPQYGIFALKNMVCI